MKYLKLVQRQREFFDSGRTKSYEFRKQQLSILQDVITKNRDNIAAAIYKDLRRPYHISLLTEADGTIEEIQYALKNLRQWMQPEQKHEEPYGVPYIYKDPLGVVLVIGPYNFPITLTLRPVISAIAAGNTVIIKPSEQSSNCSHLIYEMISRNFDEEYLAVVEGGIPETTVLLDERFDHIFYTGSVRVGRIVMSAAAINLTPCTLELGGKCPVVFTDECDLKKSVDAMLAGKFMNIGQICMAPDYVLCTRDIKDGFLRMARKWLQENFTDHPKKSPAYARMINATHCNRLMHLLEKTKGRVAYEAKDACDVLDHYIGPYLIEVEPEDILMEDEIFGPIIPIIEVNSLQEAIRFINKRERPLSAYIFSEDKKDMDLFFSEVMAGNCVSNDVLVHYYSFQIPFGGVGHSGMGRCHGKFGFDAFTHEKSVIKSSFRS